MIFKRAQAGLMACALAALPGITFTSHTLHEGGLGSDVNQAIAVNTEDGASLFRLAFSVRTVADGVVDQENAAVALASCVDCRTVALAFQIVLVTGGADVVVPINEAVAYNDQCTECLTFASATQIVVGVDGPVRLTGDGMRQLVELHAKLRQLERDLPRLTAADLVAEVSAIESALITILDTELVPIGPRSGDGDGGDDDGDRSGDSPPTTVPAGTSTTATSTTKASTATTSATTTSSSGSTTTVTTEGGRSSTTVTENRPPSTTASSTSSSQPSTTTTVAAASSTTTAASPSTSTAQSTSTVSAPTTTVGN